MRIRILIFLSIPDPGVKKATYPASGSATLVANLQYLLLSILPLNCERHFSGGRRLCAESVYLYVVFSMDIVKENHVGRFKLLGEGIYIVTVMLYV